VFAKYVHNRMGRSAEEWEPLKLRYDWMRRLVRTRWQSRALKQPCRVFMLLFFYWYSIMAWKITHEAGTGESTLCDFTDGLWLVQWGLWLLAAVFFLMFGMIPQYELMPQSVWEYDNLMVGAPRPSQLWAENS
jgi:hypothetical protein